MGQAITKSREEYAVKAFQQKDEGAHYVLEQLNFLVNAANSKLDKYQAELNEMWLDKDGTTGKKMVPGRRALRWERGYRVGVKQVNFDNEEAQKGLNEIVDMFFSAGVSVETTDGASTVDVVAGFKTHVRSSMRFILENTNAGEQEDKRFFVFVQHNAIIRIDVKVWRYNFNSEAVLANAQDVLAYVFCVSVVDHMDLSIDELTYLLSEHAGDRNVKAYVNYLLSVWKKIYEIKREVELFKMTWQLEITKMKTQERDSLSYPRRRMLNAPPSPPSSHESDAEEVIPMSAARSRAPRLPSGGGIPTGADEEA